MKLPGQQREHLRPPRIIVREGSRGGLERVYAPVVHRARWLSPSPRVGQHRAAEPVCVVELLGERGGVEQRLAKLRVTGLALGFPETDQQLAALGALAAGRLVVELSAWRYQRAASSGASCARACSAARRA